MTKLPTDYLQRTYAGWLGKVIGIRLGAQIEGWTYQKIRDVYGELDHYPADYKNFAADDDSNGPLFFLMALDQVKDGEELTAQDVGEALLNYAPYEHGFFWWGGYGVSTEHTAYLNLRSGIQAPRSGSIALNGTTVAEQIGGQIFIDTWGMVAPGNPALAAKLAREAASVTHDGNGVYGGQFVAACVAEAYVERDIRKIMDVGLGAIPQDSEYARVSRDVLAFRDAHPDNWRDCFQYVFENYGYDKYPGACHIIPNAAVMILSMAYGGGDFTNTLNICNMCGWDTDCNVGNVAAILGVMTGLLGLDREKWCTPVNDLLICSSVLGSLNAMDIPFGASYICALGYRLAGEQPPRDWAPLLAEKRAWNHFEYEGSTHALRVRTDSGEPDLHATLANTDESAFSGKRSLKMHVMPLHADQSVFLYKQTHYTPEDFSDSRYDPCFSPLVYPGQAVKGAACVPGYSLPATARMYAREQRTGELFLGDAQRLVPGEWKELALQIPARRGALISEAGFLFVPEAGDTRRPFDFTALVDDLRFEGAADYSIEMENETNERWTAMHREVSQFTRLKGLSYLDKGQLNLSCADSGEVYTGHHGWTDYVAEAAITAICGEHAALNFRVQGAIRSYAFGLHGPGKVALMKNENGYRTLAEADFDWKPGQEYILRIEARGTALRCTIGDVVIAYSDAADPYLAGCVGLSVQRGSHLRCASIALHP